MLFIDFCVSRNDEVCCIRQGGRIYIGAPGPTVAYIHYRLCSEKIMKKISLHVDYNTVVHSYSATLTSGHPSYAARILENKPFINA